MSEDRDDDYYTGPWRSVADNATMPNYHNQEQSQTSLEHSDVFHRDEEQPPNAGNEGQDSKDIGNPLCDVLDRTSAATPVTAETCPAESFTLTDELEAIGAGGSLGYKQPTSLGGMSGAMGGLEEDSAVNRPPADRRPGTQPFIMAIMGKTGSGKSSFIAQVASCNYQSAIGHGLKSETQKVAEVECYIGQRKILLVDTPGFDDTTGGDGEVLKIIADWLRDSNYKSKHLSALIYTHDINEARVGHSSVKNMILFRKITGKENMKNVILLSTKWDLLKDRSIGEARDTELRESTGFWNQMIADEAIPMRHDGTRDSAITIIEELLDNKPSILAMQKQLADGADLIHTEAGLYVNDAIIRLRKQHQEEMEELKLEMRKAEENNKAKLAESLKKHYEQLQHTVEAGKRQQEKLLSETRRWHEDKIKEAHDKWWTLTEHDRAQVKEYERELQRTKKSLDDVHRQLVKIQGHKDRDEAKHQRNEQLLRQREQELRLKEKDIEDQRRQLETRLSNTEEELRGENSALKREIAARDAYPKWGCKYCPATFKLRYLRLGTVEARCYSCGRLQNVNVDESFRPYYQRYVLMRPPDVSKDEGTEEDSGEEDEEST